ncbi:hypothetical protein IGI39_004751 [Enterococcus sp. AZ135]|uniref:hypothetical protein n=1 Tax=unclassified Enterococcus TaxID=2608891 RepID=UPI003F2241BC
MKKALGSIIGVVCFVGLFFVSTSVTASAATLYRAYNPNTGEHLYTQNSNEIPFVVSKGWNNEGTAWEAPSQGSPVYRMFNPNNGGDHHYTQNWNEVNMLKGKGWRYEGESWKSGGSTPVYRLYNPNAKTGTHHFTVHTSERDNLRRKGWRYEGVAFYSGSSTSVTVTKFTVWYTASDSADAVHNISKGNKLFNTEAEATTWIDNYAVNLSKENVTPSSYGVSSYLVQ